MSNATVPAHAAEATRKPFEIGLVLAALGVVYGDIGTSPLYTLRECLNAYSLKATPDNVFGILSLIFWAIVLVVTIKYVSFVLRADNQGEGGILALLALALRGADRGRNSRRMIAVAGMLGAALFFGDGIITPAISVLSAVEGLEVATPIFKPYIIPLTIAILIGLFAVQRRGTASVGRYFGPIMVLWFTVLALLGIAQIVENPGVLRALSPGYALAFVPEHGVGAFVTLGAVFLAVTGTEALYADMGHFGRRPITVAWLYLVMPALLLNYFGQGALLIRHPEVLDNPFYLMAPKWALLAMVLLATAATVIASQAVISGAYSLTQQAIQMGFMPRLRVIHTSDQTKGQIYLPWVNWFLLGCIIALVLGFKSSSNLAAAYGISVAGTMLATTFLMYSVARHEWRWKTAGAAAVVGLFCLVDFTFLSANSLKIFEGGWFPLAVGAAVFTVMTTWKEGRDLFRGRIYSGSMELAPFLESIQSFPPLRVPGTAVYMTTHNDVVPPALLHNLKHNKVLHERVLLLTVTFADVPRVEESARVEVQKLPAEFYRVTARFGFMEMPDVPELLNQCRPLGLTCGMMETSFFLSREQIVTDKVKGLKGWRKKLFAVMFKNAANATDFFRIPPNRVVELGSRVEV
ncbi:MAG TPA: potassium transporter Kup [Burkholderiales bacterium]|nr:potassium transporter Kup [Burkholderiales bacterium]